MSFLISTLFVLADEPLHWWDYPGFELWKFVNLAIFVTALIIVLKKANLREAFRNRRETIKRDLVRAQQERDAAVAKLKEVEERFARLGAEVANVKKQSRHETQEERDRNAQNTKNEIWKLNKEGKRGNTHAA